MKRVFHFTLALAVAALTLTSCNCFKKMASNGSSVTFVSAPEVLALNNGVVAADVTVNIPAGYFNKKSVVKITPTIVFDGGEVAAAPIYYQGVSVKDNYKVVGENGGSFTESVEFDYVEGMKLSQLVAVVEFKCDGKDEYALYDASTGSISKEDVAAAVAGVFVAEGVNTMQQDIKYGALMMPIDNSYQRVLTEVTKADIAFNISSSLVRNSTLKSSEIDDFKAKVDAQTGNDRIEQNLFANGYASPDGPEKFNDKLSTARSTSAKKAMDKILKDYGLDIDVAAYGEDWEGFKELVAASDIKDKNLILQVLSLYSSSAQREAEIKNLSVVYGELKSDILPQLRRTQMVNSSDVTGKNDEEMVALVKSNSLSELTVEELLHLAADVLTECKEKVAVLEYAASNFDDARAYNNLAILYTCGGKTDKAIAAFEKAAKMGASSKEVNNNLALVNLSNGDVDEAKKYQSAATPSTKSAIAMATGDYSAKGVEGYNAAIAAFMREDYSAASSAIAECKSADADYLRAAIAVRTGDLKVAEAQLNSAISKDASLKAKAEGDVNLKPLF
ncbi:MAG: hypothetical protein SNJ33_04135 [Rikenellaceae bacterium]